MSRLIRQSAIPDRLREWKKIEKSVGRDGRMERSDLHFE